ncbi:hypothetical protein Mal15_38060 [Stieleria maiorica]|uniref:Uncharacterized protein n=1 Tax=Stieleria maiorica TaxID=2795974 RepID=A0A5B9MIG6_9BACT|nr:hypothetical protein Mal15_38060 [Stieleria maiorica]
MPDVNGDVLLSPAEHSAGILSQTNPKHSKAET